MKKQSYRSLLRKAERFKENPRHWDQNGNLKQSAKKKLDQFAFKIAHFSQFESIY